MVEKMFEMVKKHYADIIVFIGAIMYANAVMKSNDEHKYRLQKLIAFIILAVGCSLWFLSR